MSTLSIDDATIIRRLKNHALQCKCCQEALRNGNENREDGSVEPNRTIQAGVTVTTANGDRNHSGKYYK
jgi:hypothetical protein